MTTPPPGPQQPPEPDDPHPGGQDGPPGEVPPHGRSAEDHPTPHYPPQSSHAAPPHRPPSYGGQVGGAVHSGDPLASGDIGMWWQRGIEVFQRSWRTVGALMLVGVFIPSLVLGSTYSLTAEPMTATWDSGTLGISVVTNVVPSLLVGLIVGYLTAVAWSAALWAAVKESIGQRVSIGESFKYGFRRGLPLWGWGVLAYLTISVGLLLCVLPGLYFLVSFSLLAPVATFERENPYVRSFKLVNKSFGGAVGRLLLAWLAVVVFGCVVSFIAGLLIAAFATGMYGAGLAVVTIVVNAIVSLVMLLPAVWLVGVILVTYVWARGRSEPVTASGLAAESDA